MLRVRVVEGRDVTYSLVYLVAVLGVSVVEGSQGANYGLRNQVTGLRKELFHFPGYQIKVTRILLAMF